MNKRIEIHHICGKMRPLPPGHEFALDCQPTAPNPDDWCEKYRVTETIMAILPEEMLEMIYENSTFDAKTFEIALAQDVAVGIPGTRSFQMAWLRDAANEQMTVCWPDNPGFTHEHFLDMFGYLGALLVNSSTLHHPVPERFMTYPPGYINREVYHTLDWRAYTTTLLLQFIKSRAWHKKDQLADLLRAEVDRWSGAIGRVLFNVLDMDKPRSCPPTMECLQDVATSCTAPMVPTRIEDFFKIFLVALRLKLPLVVGWEEAAGPRPPGVWVVLYRYGDPKGVKQCIGKLC
ncbi:hypothetical protein CDD82_684 [Ophiocordyceps australis]|uniref:Uncharacterized protein n=1 Tax=Ophiocordyceps australis TaxID=1399860 RepID=A0A2C5YLA0_9HYPO|nr:hypothetical protein CDD82_684 [Ophiocordyceps australis]